MLARPQNPRSTTRRSAFVQGRLIRSARRSAAENGVGVTDNFIGAGPSRIGLGLFAVALAIFLCTVPARAAARLHGLILGIDAAKGQVVVRHDPFDGMPGMTMPFALKDQAETAKVRVGNGIDADVDETTEPWTLSNVHISGQQNVTGATVFRSTKRLRIGDPLPDTRFVDQDGRPFRFAQLKDQYVVMAFIYTRCKDARMCPLITSKFAQCRSGCPRTCAWWR